MFITDRRLLRGLLCSCVASLATAVSSTAFAQHSAQALALDLGANINGFYAFRSWNDPDKAVFVLNVVPGQEPGDGPLYYTFDDSVTYEIHIDNDRDGVADDVVYQFRFSTQHRAALGMFNFIQPYLGHPDIPFPELEGITALDGPNSAGITERQTYEVTEHRHGRHEVLFRNKTLVAVPPNVGSNTMPDYEALAAQGIYSDPTTGIRVFAGQRAETFYADLAALFDTGHLRGFPLLTAEQDANDFVNPFGANRNSGFNVNSIVIEVPISRLTVDGKSVPATAGSIIGAYGSTNRSRHPEHEDGRDRDDSYQVARMGNPIVSMLLIETPAKDAWNHAKPENDAQFLSYFTNPSPPKFPTTPFVFKIPSPPPPRLELVRLFLKYPGQPLNGERCGSPCADLLRLDLSVPPTLPENQHRMGSLLGGDPAGMPNGRRPNDDALDFGVRVIGGPMPIAARLGDGVNFLEGAPGAGTADGIGYGRIPGNRLDVTVNGIAKEFPFLPTPYDGQNHHHLH